MAAPLAPTVQGPIVPSSTHVAVSGALAGAKVTVLVAPGAQKVGEQTAGADGGLLVPLFGSLTVGRLVFAQQSRSGQSSQPSNVGVPVVAVPNPLPIVVFASPLTECMDRILLSGLVPGAVVTVKHGGTTLGTSTVTTTSAWVAVDPALLNAGMVLTAVQKVAGAGSAPCSSPPLAALSHQEGLAPPKIGQPLVACDTTLLVSDVIPAGETQLDVDGDVMAWTNIASSYYATGARLPSAGTFKARQLLPGCRGESAKVDVPVGPPVTPPAPTVRTFCPEIRRVLVTGLKPSGVLKVSAREFSGTTETEIGELGFSTTEAQVDLPDKIGGQGPPMNIVARQVRCGLTSPPGQAAEFARPGSGALPPPTPKITEPLFACMRAVPATGLLNGVLTQVVSASTGTPLGDQIVVSAPTARLPTWFPLQAGDRVQVTQEGCSAPATSAEVTVKPLPSPLPIPKILAPVRPGAHTVVADGCLPGSRLLLLVNEVERAATEQTWTGQAIVEAGKPPLVDGDQLFCVQRLCTESSNIEGPRVRVTKGRMKIDVAPSSVPGGKAASLLVSAHDADTNADLPGRPVTLGGSAVGVTGTAFGWTAPAAGASVSGTVAGGNAYFDAGFSIALRQAIPLNLTLTPGPTVLPGQVWQTDVVWTVVPEWGAAAVTVNGNTPVAMVPPPPNPGDRVRVNLSLKAHLQGNIGGIDWPLDVIDISGTLGFVALTKPTHAMSGLFSYGAQSVPVVDDDGTVTGYEDRLFAKVDLLGVA